jgi:hypothetical protein
MCQRFRITDLLCDDMVLVLLKPDNKFVISCDASKIGLGAGVFVVRDGIYYPVSFVSRTLTDVETLHSNSDCDGLAVVWVGNTVAAYTWGSPYRIETNLAALIPLFSQGDLTGRFARYMYGLQHHDIELVQNLENVTLWLMLYPVVSVKLFLQANPPLFPPLLCTLAVVATSILPRETPVPQRTVTHFLLK